ncbi:recombinase family protein [Photobacterium sp. DA100]|uniref:recombinase family protein n=1 Tax=Photobacterium sp. DA100 TaxID=3027472 RepID=UPI002478AAEE|nr:recombinase family protein [Photobacterium sp. DA100]WEM41001.1 recombinase family protein [Photobacterium sp. DA100]
MASTIRVYLRASTTEQDATRGKTAVSEFLEGFCKPASKVEHYVENVSGATLDRPELNRLIADSNKGDVLVVEQIDRLTRLSAHDWKALKRTIEDTGLNIVSIDLPTSHLILNQGHSISLVGDILSHVNTLLLEILATSARKDYEDRRRRQAEGIEKAKAEGKFRGKQRSQKTIQACQAAMADIEKGLSKEKAAKANGIGVATLYRYIRDTKSCLITCS